MLISCCAKLLIIGNEEVKLAILSAIAAWAARSSDSLQPELLSLFASGLKEKESLRRGHLRCLRVIAKNSDVVAQVRVLVVFLLSLHLLLSFLICNSFNLCFW